MLSLRNFSLVLGLTTVSVSLVSACVITSETDDPSGPSYAHPSEADFCAALARAQCTDSAVKACYGSGDADVETDRGKCIARRSDSAVCRASVTGGVEISSPRYNPDQETQKCIDAQGGVYADAALNRTELDAAVLACIKIFSGPSGGGESCDNDYDCDTTDGLQCVIKSGPLGICAVPTLVTGGDDCTAAGTECEPTFYCAAVDTSSSACLKRKGEGVACSPTIACFEELNCVITDPELETGTCMAKLGNGETCEVANPEACQGTFCNAPSGQTAGECATNLALAGTSASCDAF